MKKAIVGFGLALAVALVGAGCNQELGVKKVSPAVGVLAGGEPVDILGSGFEAGMGVTVYFGNSKASNVVIRNSGKLTVTTPSSDEAVSVDVRVITDTGKEFLLREAFRYITKSNMDIRDLGQRKSLRDKD